MPKPERILTRHYKNGIINVRADDDPWQHPPSSGLIPAGEGGYVRADLLESEKEAAVAAEREACAELVAEYENHRSWADWASLYSAIANRADTDAQAALEAVKREARNEALREAAEICAAARDKRNKQRNEYPDESRDVKQRWMAGALQSQSNADAILALIPADQEEEEG